MDTFDGTALRKEHANVRRPCQDRPRSRARHPDPAQGDAALLQAQRGGTDAAWLLFDGELSKLGQAARIDDLMTRQGELHDALEGVIADFEELAVQLKPAPEE